VRKFRRNNREVFGPRPRQAMVDGSDCVRCTEQTDTKKLRRERADYYSSYESFELPPNKKRRQQDQGEGDVERSACLDRVGNGVEDSTTSLHPESATITSGSSIEIQVPCDILLRNLVLYVTVVVEGHPCGLNVLILHVEADDDTYLWVELC
jgi:hypothetical protein